VLTQGPAAVSQERGLVFPAHPYASDQVVESVKNKLIEKINSFNALCPDIRIKVAPRLDRDNRKMGKLRLVKSNVKKDRSPKLGKK
jgi:hypothetical protein